MKKGEKIRPKIVFNPFSKLAPKEKEWLRATLTDPRYIKLLGIVQQYRPASKCAKAGSKDRDEFSNERAAARLSEMCGWDLYETAIFAVLTDVPELKPQPEASFPDTGRVDAHWGQLPPTSDKTK